MYFGTLPQNMQIEVLNLVTDEVFRKRLDNDEKLDQLDELKYDPFVEYCEMQLLLHNKLEFYGVQLNPLTCGLWAYLYTIKSPMVITDKKEFSILDLDIFFYLLQTGQYNLKMDELSKKAFNYVEKVLHLTYSQAIDILKKLTKVNFRVLNMFPRIQAKRETMFNADWLCSIVSKVKQVSTYTTQQLYNEVSWCEMYYLMAQYCREYTSESIYLRTQEEIYIEEDLRQTEIVVDRLIEKNVMQQKDREYYIKEIHNKKAEQK